MEYANKYVEAQAPKPFTWWAQSLISSPHAVAVVAALRSSVFAPASPTPLPHPEKRPLVEYAAAIISKTRRVAFHVPQELQSASVSHIR